MKSIIASAATAAIAVGSVGYNAYHSMQAKYATQAAALAASQQNLQLIESAAATVVSDCKMLSTYLPGIDPSNKLAEDSGAYVVPRIQRATVSHE